MLHSKYCSVGKVSSRNFYLGGKLSRWGGTALLYYVENVAGIT